MTSQRIGFAITVAAAALLLPAAPQAVEIKAGDWTLGISGNVNAHYIYSSCEDSALPVTGGLACLASAGEDNSSSISNGLLPAAIAFNIKTNQRGYDLGVTFGFFPGISTNDGGSPNLGPLDPLANTNTALGTVSIDMRQVFLTFGNERMGEFMFGRNIGLFGQDAILADMTLGGVGAGNGNYAAPFNTSLGSIGLGYIYTDWLAQMNYTTPDMSGFTFTLGVFDPLEPIFQGTPTPKGPPGAHAKAAYTYEGLKLSASFLYQQQEGVTNAGDYNSNAFDVFAKYEYGPAEIMGYYYNGRGVGTTGLFILSDDGNGNRRDSDGFLVQLTYKIADTKLGANYGRSNLDLADGELPSALVSENSKYTLGVYHSLTEALTLVAEFTDTKAEAHNGIENDSWNVNVGAFLTF